MSHRIKSFEPSDYGIGLLQPYFKALEKTAFSSIAHSIINSRLKTMDVRVFEQLHEKAQQELSNHYAEKEVLKCYNIKRFDPTIISVLSHLLKGMEANNTKNHKTVKN